MRDIVATTVHRVVADRRLARQHHGVGAVEDGVGDVADLGPGRRRRVDHRLQHLGRRDHRLADAHAEADDLLLQVRHVLEREVDAEVAARDHQRVGRRGDGSAGRRRRRWSRSWPRSRRRRRPRPRRASTSAARRTNDRATYSTPASTTAVREHEVVVGGCVHLQPFARQVDARATLEATTALDLGEHRRRRRRPSRAARSPRRRAPRGRPDRRRRAAWGSRP